MVSKESANQTFRFTRIPYSDSQEYHIPIHKGTIFRFTRYHIPIHKGTILKLNIFLKTEYYQLYFLYKRDMSNKHCTFMLQKPWRNCSYLTFCKLGIID